MKKQAFFGVLFFTGLAFAQTVAPEVGAGAINALTQLNDKMPAAIPGTVLSILVFVIEMVMRLYPTAKPKSLFIVAASGLALVGSLFIKISKLLDSVAQNLKPDEEVKK